MKELIKEKSRLEKKYPGYKFEVGTGIDLFGMIEKKEAQKDCKLCGHSLDYHSEGRCNWGCGDCEA